MALSVRWALGVLGDILKPLGFLVGFPGGSDGEESASNAGALG